MRSRSILLGVNEIYIGCPVDYENDTFSGIVYIFDGNWVNKAKLTPKGKFPTGYFGDSIATS